MLRPRVIVLSASLLATAIATPLTAQRLEVAARVGYSPPTGTQFQVAHAGSDIRSWNGGALSVGAVASYWLLSHFGIQGTVDLRLTRHYVTEVTTPSNCWGVPGCGFPGPPPVDASASQLVASLRLAARQELGNRLQLSAGLGPAMIRFGDVEYQPSGPLDFTLANRTAYGVAGGLSAAYAVSSRLRLTLSTDDVIFRVRPAAAPIPAGNPGGGFTTVVAPLQHEFTFSAVVSVLVL
jgi:hypothetical protein